MTHGKLIKYPNNLNISLIHKNTVGNKTTCILMMPFSKEQQDFLNDKKFIKINNKFLTPADIYCFGEIDFDDEDDLDCLDSFEWIKSNFSGVPFPSNYDFESHTSISYTEGIQYSETFDNVLLAQFAYASIGKPQSCIIFKCSSDSIGDLISNDRRV